MNRSAGSRKKRRRKLPPGQRLLVYIMLAAATVCLQAESIPAGVPPVEADKVAVCVPTIAPFQMSHRLDDVQKALVEQACKPDLNVGLFAVEPTTGRFVDINGQETFAAASMIKMPILVDLLIAMDKKKVQPDQLLVIRPDLIAGGSGFLQWRPPGTKISLQETASLMIIFSDNTATNMIIDVLGGRALLNRDFRQWGLKQTRIENWLPDFDGTNKTSPYDMTYLLGRVDAGELISPQSKKYMYDIMYKTTIRTLLPPGLPPGSKIAHKTGDIGGMVGDAGVVTAPNGKRYFVAVQVERRHNDHRANELIRDLSRIVYAGLVDDVVAPPVQVSAKHQTTKPAQHHRRRHRRRGR